MEIVTNFPDAKAIVPENDEVLFIDHSISSTFRCCEEKARLAYVKHYAGRSLALPLAFGSAMHKAIETYHNNTGLVTAMKLGIDAINKSIEEDGSQMPRYIANADDEKRSIERCHMLFAAYTQRWADEPYITKLVEIGFAIDIGVVYRGKPIIYVGKIDRVVEKPYSKTIHNVETKTTGTALSVFMGQSRPNHQITGYHVANRELLGIKPDSTIWDAIYISSRKPDKKKGGWFEYGIDFDKDFDRQETRRSDVDIEEWYYDIRRDSIRFFEYRDSVDKRWSRNTSMCHSYGGCGFKLICETNLNDAIINSEYVVKPWLPWKGIINGK